MKNRVPVITGVTFVAVALLVFWLSRPSSPPPPAPIDITWRPSKIHGLVMQVHNTSGQYLGCGMAVFNTNQNQFQTYSFSLDAYKQQEIGIMECGWEFVHGEHGHVDVEGYPQKEFTVP